MAVMRHLTRRPGLADTFRMSVTADAPTRFAVMAQVGPGDKAVADAADLLDSLLAHEPAAEVVLVDDVPGRDLGSLLRKSGGGGALRVVSNPRDGRGRAMFGGMTCGTFAGLREAGRDPAVAFVVKLDTDALVIAPFADRLAVVVREHPRVGVVGAYRTTPNGTPRDFSRQAASVALLRRRLLFGRERDDAGRHWPTGLGERRPTTLRRLVRAAGANGYELGEHCQGGAYAVTRAGLDALGRTGAFADPLLWFNMAVTEDAAVALHVRAAGLVLLGQVADGQVFGVRYAGLPGPPRELLDRGFGLIHSVKNDPRHAESDVRDFFRRHRRSGERPPLRGIGTRPIADLAAAG